MEACYSNVQDVFSYGIFNKTNVYDVREDGIPVINNKYWHTCAGVPPSPELSPPLLLPVVHVILL